MLHTKHIGRIKGYYGIIFVVLALFLWRLAVLQIINQESYQAAATDNRTRLLTIPAGRGDILSSDGVVLATDRPIFQVVANNQIISTLEEEQKDEMLSLLVELIADPEITKEAIDQQLADNIYRLYEPIIIKKGLEMEKVSQIEARRSQLPGISIVSIPERCYLQGDLAGHVLGYIGEVSPEELDAQIGNQYKMGDYLGKIGLEKYYDDALRGVDGLQQVAVDVYNHPNGEMEMIAPKAGDNLQLTLNYDLQLTMEQAFDEVLAQLQSNPRSDKASAGAAVLMEVKTGKVLAMASRPNDKITQQNRAIQGRYIPGSTFKMVTACAALESGAITPETTFLNTGRYWEPPYIGTTAPVGWYDVYKAIAKSDNVFFQAAGHRAGIDNIALAGQALGLEGATGIDLAYESQGERVTEGLPTEEKRTAYHDWAASNQEAIYDQAIADAKERHKLVLAEVTDSRERAKLEKANTDEIKQLEAKKKAEVNNALTWRPADTFNIAIGQGRQNYTPLQLAVYVATIANGGTVYQPYVVEQIQDDQGEIIVKNQPIVKRQSGISQQTLEVVRDAMVATASPGGTAYGLFKHFPKEIQVGAKTGTAQPGQKGYKVTVNGRQKQYYDGVFVAFAPADDPEIVFACVVEYGYSGGGSAGIICQKVFERYFALDGH